MKVRKLPVEVEAVQWTGDNFDEMNSWVTHLWGKKGRILVINTLEGKMEAQPGDYIIKGVNGEFYPCKADIFEKTYEVVE